MKIGVKFTAGLSVILIALGLVLNILIRQALISNMESRINDSLKEIMNSTSEYIKYRLITNSSALNEEALSKEAGYIIKNLSMNYECNSEIRDMKGNIIENEGNKGLGETLKRGTESAIKGKAVVNLKYSNNSVNGILSYPIYINDSYIGIVNINKDYKLVYSAYANTVRFITVIEIAIFVLIFILAWFMTSRITKPITKLTKAVKEVSEGNYEGVIKVHGKDEVAVLSKEFVNMKDKIKEQIETIKLEKEKVEKLEKGRRNFFNGVTHELKTPLTAISGYAEMIIDDMVKDEEFNKRAVRRIYSESERLHKLVLDLIDVSKGLSSVDEEKVQVDMCRLLNQVCDDMSIKARKYSLEISRDVKAGSILGQVNKIKELIINIIDNAIKYSSDEDKIIVSSKVEDGYYKIEVINKAEPIPDEVYNNIFDPFVKCENGAEKHSRGLGLYICSEIVKEHNGEISIENGKFITTKVKIPSFVNKLETT